MAEEELALGWLAQRMEAAAGTQQLCGKQAAVFMGTSATLWSERETRAIAGISGAGGMCLEKITEMAAMVVTLKWLGNFF